MFPMLATVLAIAFAALVLAAAARDALSFIIPNWISVALVALFAPAALAAGLSWPAVGVHLGIGAIALVAGMVMFALRWVGGGDAKLLAAAGLWMGWPAVLTYLTAGALVGGGLAIILLSIRSPRLRPLALLGPPWMARLSDPGEGVPYGIAIAAGALIALPASPLAGALAGL
jgi:prepilin peptidase CpaA